MKVFLSVLFICSFTFCEAQNNYPKLEAYAAPGFFLEQLSTDTLIPAKRRNSDRLGDVTSYALQVALPLKNKRWNIKAGLGLSQRHYSINKYSLDDIFVSLFLFDSQLRRDSFSLSYVKFTNNYFQVPVSLAYTVTRPLHNFQVAIGVNFRSDFLTNSHARVDFDEAYKIPSQADIEYAQTTYTANATRFVFTAEPYVEGSFLVYKKLGLLIQLRPFSFYASDLDKRLTTSTVEIFSSTFGIFYRLK